MSPTKYFLLIAGFVALSSAAYADKLGQDGILQKDDGSIHRMTQYEASGVDPTTKQKVKPDVCEAFGAHLPTIRELAKISQAAGAKGILETDQVPNGIESAPEGYYLVDATNPDGKQNKFYFNSDGYKRPQGDLGNNWFWSSSVASFNSDVAYDLHGYYGEVNDGSYGGYRVYDNGAVRCVRGE